MHERRVAPPLAAPRQQGPALVPRHAAEGLVEDGEAHALAQQRPGDAYALALASRQAASAVAQRRVPTLGHRGEDGIEVGRAGCRTHFRCGCGA
jgi:hypothetical protein